MKKDKTTEETTEEPKPDELKDEELEKATGGVIPCIDITTGVGGGASFDCLGDGHEPPPRVVIHRPDGTTIVPTRR